MMLLFIVLMMILTSCGSAENDGLSLSVTTWNLYAMFDGVSDGDEFDGFSKSDGYTSQRYEDRVRDTAVFIGKHFPSDVIILQEVESPIVLSDLITSALWQKGYRYYGLAGSEEALSVGFISRIEPLAVRMHGIAGSRPILELSLMVGSEHVRIYGIHGRSRLHENSEDVRASEFALLSSLMADGDMLSMAAGDFNADPRYKEKGIARYPDDFSSDTSLPVAGDPGKSGNGVLYSPQLDEDIILEAEGTYCYDGEWYFYDSVLMNEHAYDSSGLEFSHARIERHYEAMDMLSRPLAYDASTGKGFSDHFAFTVFFSSRR